MNNIPPELLAEVLREVEDEKGCPDKYDVSIEDLFERLIAKNWQLDTPLLYRYRSSTRTIPFQHPRYPQAEQAANPRQL